MDCQCGIWQKSTATGTRTMGPGGWISNGLSNWPKALAYVYAMQRSRDCGVDLGCGEKFLGPLQFASFGSLLDTNGRWGSPLEPTCFLVWQRPHSQQDGWTSDKGREWIFFSTWPWCSGSEKTPRLNLAGAGKRTGRQGAGARTIHGDRSGSHVQYVWSGGQVWKSNRCAAAWGRSGLEVGAGRDQDRVQCR
ncbi:hypothetical protein BKA80DRAFT_276446 [Phyllosticta citrichinensis]